MNGQLDIPGNSSASAERPKRSLEEILRVGATRQQHPSETLSKLLQDTPDDQLDQFLDLAWHVNDVAFSYFHSFTFNRYDAQPVAPDFTRARVTEDERFMIPITDRHILDNFLRDEDTAEALEMQYSDYSDKSESHPPLESSTISLYKDGAETSPDYPKIDGLPVTGRPINPADLFGIAETYYWSTEGQKQYISLADTLKDLARDARPEELIPLILTIEKYFPLELDDERYKPIAWPSYYDERVVEDGIVWEVYDAEDLRHQLESACQPESFGFDAFYGFDGERFNDEYYEFVAEQNRSEDNEYGRPTEIAARDEQDQRFNERFRLY